MRGPPRPRQPGGGRTVTSLRRLGTRLLCCAALVIVTIAGLAFWQLQRLAATARWVDHTDEVIAQINLAHGLLVDKESSLRAYVHTRAPVFLEGYREARPAEVIEALGRLVSDNPPQVERVHALRDHLLTWLRSSESALAHPDEGGTLEAALVRKAEMDQMRADVAALLQEEEGLRSARAAQKDREIRLTEIGGAVVLLVGGAVMAALSGREIRRLAEIYEDALTRSVASEQATARAAEGERAARRGAEEALQLKDEFLWTLSHELRTQLSAVIGWAGLLRTRQISGPKAERALEIIERGARAEARIVEDLLDASRIATGKIQLRVQPASLDDVAASAIEVCREMAAAKGIVVDHVRAPDPPVVRGDPNRLQQVVWNLVANAIKFSPRGRRVEVRTAGAGDHAVLQVRDQGEGIPPEFLPHVFERFRQADASQKRPHGGLGLGLSIAKHFVELHGGTIQAESEGLGRGATFTVSLPSTGAAVGRAPPRAPQPPRSLRAMRVLVVEDDPDTLALVTTVLEEQGAVVHPSTRGTEALAFLAATEVDMLVSDVGLPDIDGYALLARARAVRGGVPALALTAFAGADDVKRAHLAGYDRHMPKPFSPDLLVAALAELGAPREPPGDGSPVDPRGV